MRGGAVSFKWDRGFWPGVMTSGEMRSALLQAADLYASAARARIGSPSRPRKFANPDFATRTAIRHGSTSNYYVGLVIAANPRSIYKARHDGALGK